MSADETAQTFDPAPLDGWQIDSPTVVEQLLAAGGQAFIDEYDEVSLKVTLDATGTLVWEGTLIAADAQKLFRRQMDPATGQIIE